MRPIGEFPGEDIHTSALPEVAGWISIYEELGAVLSSVLARADGTPQADEMRRQLSWIENRLAAWRDRHAELAGVVIDRNEHTLTYAGKSLKLTRREADLLDFLLRHPKRPFTSRQLATLAWHNSRLSDAQVRTYIMRLRSRLREVGLEEVITVARNQGYGITASLGGGGRNLDSHDERWETEDRDDARGQESSDHLAIAGTAIQKAHAQLLTAPARRNRQREPARPDR